MVWQKQDLQDGKHWADSEGAQVREEQAPAPANNMGLLSAAVLTGCYRGKCLCPNTNAEEPQESKKVSLREFLGNLTCSYI